MICKNGMPYEFKPSDAMSCKVLATSAQSTRVPHVVEPTSPIGKNTFKVSFTTKVAGRYIISVKINSKSVTGGEIYRKYLPGGCGWVMHLVGVAVDLDQLIGCLVSIFVQNIYIFVHCILFRRTVVRSYYVILCLNYEAGDKFQF